MQVTECLGCKALHVAREHIHEQRKGEERWLHTRLVPNLAVLHPEEGDLTD